MAIRLPHKQEKAGSIPALATEVINMILFFCITSVFSLTGALLVLWYSIKKLEKENEILAEEIASIKRNSRELLGMEL